MLRSLVSSVMLAIFLAANLYLPVKVSARRCDEKPPETLLSLYRNSTAIFVARFEKAEDFAITEEGEDYTVADVRKHFSISSTLKGEPLTSVVLSEEEYRYQPIEEGENKTVEAFQVGEEAYEEQFGPVRLEPGDRVLLFLKRSEDGQSLVVTDYRDAVKKLNSDEMAAYERRVNELSSIFAAKKVNDAEIVQWLVRAAEDPLTRWEGAFELLSSFERAEWKLQHEKNLREKAERGEKIEDWELEFGNEYGDGETSVDTTIYSSLLTEAQKERLLNVVLETRPAPAENDEKRPAAMSEGDRVLMELVSRWGGSRLAVYMIDRLRSSGEHYWVNAQMMEKIAKVFDDGEVTRLAEKYAELYYSDDEIVDESENTPEEITEPVDTEEPSPEQDPNETHGPEGPEKGSAENIDPPAKKTYGELRAEIMAKFIERCDLVLADPERQFNLD